jgi:hypothetical protein
MLCESSSLEVIELMTQPPGILDFEETIKRHESAALEYLP